MADPNFEIYDSDGILVSSGNPIAFGLTEKGSVSNIVTVTAWNDKDSILGSDTAIAPKVSAVHGTDNAASVFNGTAINGNNSILEARSCEGINVPADRHSSWYPIRTNQFMVMGDMPKNTGRTIEIRWNVPQDAPNLNPVITFSFRVLY